MRLIKRLMLYSAGVWAFAALASCYSIYLSRGTPSWYRARTLSAAQQAIAANESDQKLADLLSYASDIAAAQHRRRTAGGADAADVIGPKTITFTEDQINAFAEKWQLTLGERLGRYVTGSRLILVDHHLILAGVLKDMGLLSNTVMSIEFDSTLDEQGRVWPKLSQVYSGRFPVPWPILSSPARKARRILSGDLPAWERLATFSADGTGNRYAAEAVLGKLLLASLDRTSVDSILLIPCDATDVRRVTPVRVESMNVSDGAMTVTIRPLSDSELGSVAEDVRGVGDVGMTR